MMLVSLRERKVTLLDVVAAVSGFADSEEEAALVINHLFGSEQIAFTNRPQRTELEAWLI
ncbi:MAG TPA: hypothetical protein VMG11_04855 [Steroidobacteraceae bacterium]|nr:hypothetical protein [Steroidobacteraceae bacterium]